MKVVIIGAGLTGACCALALAGEGHGVTVIDEHASGEATTASSGSAILYQTKDSPLHVGLTRKSLSLWDDLAAACDIPFSREGSHVLFAGEEQEEFVAQRAAMLRECGVAVERLARGDLEGRMPALHPDIRGAYYCPEDGEAHPRQSCIGILSAAVKAGVRVCLGERFEGIGSVGGTHVRTSEQTIACDAVIVAAGHWTPAIVAPYGLDVPSIPERGEQLLTYPAPRLLKGRIISARYTRGKKAGAFVGLALGQEYDGRIKIGSTREPGQTERVTSERARAALLEELALAFPELARMPIERQTVGIRSGSPTGLPIVARGDQPVTLIAIDGMGGNGVAYAPLVADIAADMLAGRESEFAAGLRLQA
ncbi:MAG: FAD-binding oxidoreductase [Salinarimonadaceae bacterium]|nr:MAG: FAD-binding oxidoreductase [Salinarimonadaceae bacterium]